MVKCLITYKNPSNTYIENLTYCKTHEVLIFTTKILDDSKKAVNTIINELGTSNADMRKIRGFLNGLNLEGE